MKPQRSRSKRIPLLVLLAFILGAALLMYISAVRVPVEAPIVAAVVPPPPSPKPPPTLTTSIPPEAPPPPEPEEPPAAEPEPPAPEPVGNPGEEALLAVLEDTGYGWVQCDLPAGVGELHRGSPEWSAIKWATVADGVLTMATKSPIGTFELLPVRPKEHRSGETPAESADESLDEFNWYSYRNREANARLAATNRFGVAQWTGATPGKQGTCTVLPNDLIQFTVVASRIDGSPAENASVFASYATRPSRLTDANGRCQVEGVAGALTHISVAHYETDLNIETETVVSDGKVVELVQTSEGEERHDERMREFVKGPDLNRVDEDMHHLAEAQNTPGLSEAARGFLEEWRGQEDAFRQKIETRIARADAMLEEQRQIREEMSQGIEKLLEEKRRTDGDSTHDAPDMKALEELKELREELVNRE